MRSRTNLNSLISNLKSNNKYHFIKKSHNLNNKSNSNNNNNNNKINNNNSLNYNNNTNKTSMSSMTWNHKKWTNQWWAINPNHLSNIMTSSKEMLYKKILLTHIHKKNNLKMFIISNNYIKKNKTNKYRLINFIEKHHLNKIINPMINKNYNNNNIKNNKKKSLILTNLMKWNHKKWMPPWWVINLNQMRWRITFIYKQHSSMKIRI